jgi:protein FRG1
VPIPDLTVFPQVRHLRFFQKMVTKLKFKGEKHKKRKRDEDDPENQRISHQNDNNDEGWVDAESLDDISTGPLFITFASSPPIAVASDPIGKIYASVLKVSDEADLGNAEPNDVRQVWIATRLTESSKISLKTPNGKFLSCDKVGILSASKEAIGPQEEWQPLQREDGWAFQNVYEHFLYSLLN